MRFREMFRPIGFWLFILLYIAYFVITVRESILIMEIGVSKMPCSGPTPANAERCAEYITKQLYIRITNECNKPLEKRSSSIFNMHALVNRMYQDLEITYNKYDFARYKYSLLGYLHAILPLTEYKYNHYNADGNLIVSGTSYTNVRFSQINESEFKRGLTNLFFKFDCEDF